MGRSTGIRRPAAAAFFAVLALLAVPAAASAATAVQFSLATPATATAGVQLTGIQITARDSGNAIDTTYNGPVSLTSNDPAATLTPNPVTLTNGVGTFGCSRPHPWNYAAFLALPALLVHNVPISVCGFDFR